MIDAAAPADVTLPSMPAAEAALVSADDLEFVAAMCAGLSAAARRLAVATPPDESLAPLTLVPDHELGGAG